MLSKINKIISILLTIIFIAGIFPPVIFAEPNQVSLGEVKGFNRAVIDNHFSKADRELNPEHWLAEARFGVTQAICAWELIADNLYDNPLLYEEAKAQIEKWSDEELEKRFSQWLMGRFFGKAAEEALNNLSSNFSESQKKYSWHLDKDGNVLFDEKTGDPLVIRPNEEGREFSRDLALWHNDSNDIVNNTSVSFDNSIIRLYPELLAYIPVESRESMSEIISKSLIVQRNVIKQEFENIAAREERIFTNRRTRDIWSLRKKSDDETAKIFTEKLIAETDEACKRGIEEINTKIEQASAGAGDLAILGEEWLRLYKEQFERGLKAWEEAEERFFIRRMEWEQDSFRLFEEGQDIWLSAFNQFKEGRKNWEQSAGELFQAGADLFAKISEDFEKTIADAKDEFNLTLTIRMNEGTNKVEALINIYLTCASTAMSSMENIRFWQKQYGNNEKNIRDEDFSDWILQEIANLWIQAESRYIYDPVYINDFNILEDLKERAELNPSNTSYRTEYEQYLTNFNKKYSNLSQVQRILKGEMPLSEQIAFAKTIDNENFSRFKFEALIEMQNSYNMYSLYLNKSLEARNSICENYGELFGTSALYDILSNGVSSDDFYLDEYQVALLRAKALVLYWERKTSIADAVMDYATELSAGRMTEAEGIQAWEDAKKTYNESLADYETALNSLNTIGGDVKSQQEVLQDLTIKLQNEENILNYLYAQYSSLVSISAVNMDDYYLTILKEKYKALEEKYNSFLITGDNSVYHSVLKYGMLYDIAKERETGEVIDTKLWQNTCDSLSQLFKNYDLKTENNIFPDVQSLCTAIFNKTGDFAENTAEFLLKFDNCLSEIPEWLEYEINNWKEALIYYITIYFLNENIPPQRTTDEIDSLSKILIDNYSGYDLYLTTHDDSDDKFEEVTTVMTNTIIYLFKLDYMHKISDLWESINLFALENNELHWRQYFKNEFITNENSVFKKASSWKEGMLEDALFNALICTNRVNDSFIIYSQKDTFSSEDTADNLFYLYCIQIDNLNRKFNLLNSQYNVIINSVKDYSFSKLSPDETQEQLSSLEAAIDKQKNAIIPLREQYYKEAENFLVISSQYDSQYVFLKTAYNNTDQKRFEYEKQDAIQKWASSSYIKTDSIDRNTCRANLQKAQNVLEALSGISNNQNKIIYNSSEYEALFSAYEQNFSKNVKALETMEALSSEYMLENIYNQNIYVKYEESLFMLGRNFNYKNYNLPESRSEWTIENIITVKDGRLAFSTDDSMYILGVDSTEDKSVINYFNNRTLMDGERFEISDYEKALRDLNQRISGYFTDQSKYITWSYARNYLLSSLINANGDLSFLNKYLSTKTEIHKGGSLADEYINLNKLNKDVTLLSYMNDYYFYINANTLFQNAWNDLSAEEKADLEFYVILTLTTNSDYFRGFKDMYSYDTYSYAANNVYSLYKYAETMTKTGLVNPVWYLWYAPRDLNKSTYKRISSVYSETAKSVNSWIFGLQNNIESINKLSSLYAASCEKLYNLEGKKTDDQSITWADLEQAFILSKIKTDDIAILKTCWEEMQKNKASVKFQNVYSALTGLTNWTKNQVSSSKKNLEIRFAADMQKQQENEETFLSTIDDYFNGTANINRVKTAAKNAYEEKIISSKYYLDNMYTVLINNLSLNMDTNFNLNSLFNEKGIEICELTKKTITNKYNAERTAREAEWAMMRKDIAEKQKEWLNTAEQILENGRADWEQSYKKLQDSYKEWYTNFQNEYKRVNDEWSYAYIAGLEDKEKWLEQAADAANQASSEAFLSLVGSEGERLARFMDTREPFGIRDAVPEAQALMSALLQSSGIVNMANTFNSINNYTGVISPLVRRGMGGASSWDSAFVKAAASNLAKEANGAIAQSESKKLAYNAHLYADEAIKGLAANVKTANQGFRESMDNMFIFKGLWRRGGSGYIKDVIKGSTIFNPVITKTVTVDGYRDYVMEPVTLRTNLDDNFLSGLDTVAIQGLINNVYIEVESIAGKIFGHNQEPTHIDDDRTQSPGLFGAHIGYSPAVKNTKKATTNRKDMFSDEGAGELGRLVADFQYWYVVDKIGSAELTIAPWDKRMWDDEGSWFQAPNLRLVGAVIGTIVAAACTFGAGGVAGIAGIALSIAICSSTEITLGALDVAYDYKPIDEVAVSVGKTILANTVTSVAGGIFSSASTVVSSTANSAASSIIAKTAIAGTQNLITGAATSVINGITYSSEKGFGFSAEAAISSLKRTLNGSLTSMASAFTSSGLTAINSGFDFSKLKGFNKLDLSDLKTLNDLIGSAAGQGVNYALGNDFTLNVLNLNSFSGYNSGLLELHLGHDGVTMNIGTGGTDVSIENLKSAYKGAQVWNVNTKISNYGKKNDFDALIALRVQYGYGDNVQKEQLRDILNGKALINTDTERDITKTTINEDGKRVINLAGYQKGMSEENQYLLGTVLGYEAYRDGYTVGQTTASGEMYTYQSNLLNVMNATGATLEMVDRIKKENDWFGATFDKFAFNDFIEKDMGLILPSRYESYYEEFYTKGTMNFNTTTRNNYQNNLSRIPLFYSATEAEVAATNEQNAWAAFEKYKNISFSYDKADSVQEFKAKYKEEFEAFKKNEELMKDNGYKKETFYSLPGYGCVFMCTKYGLETILGEEVNTKALYEYVKNKDYFTAGNKNGLSVENMAEIMTEQTNGAFTVKYLNDSEFNKLSAVEKLNIINSSNEQYLIQLRIKDTSGKFQDDHSVMVSKIEFTKDREGNITGISNIIAANPYIIKDHIFGLSNYSPSDIVRWDFFKVTQNKK